MKKLQNMLVTAIAALLLLMILFVTGCSSVKKTETAEAKQTAAVFPDPDRSPALPPEEQNGGNDVPSTAAPAPTTEPTATPVISSEPTPAPTAEPTAAPVTAAPVPASDATPEPAETSVPEWTSPKL